jgi:cytochrome c biogenesis protein CcdA
MTPDTLFFVGIVLAFYCFAVALYFLPTIVAASRGHHNRSAIFMLNLLTGWTFVGWVAAFVWSYTAVRS